MPLNLIRFDTEQLLKPSTGTMNYSLKKTAVHNLVSKNVQILKKKNPNQLKSFYFITLKYYLVFNTHRAKTLKCTAVPLKSTIKGPLQLDD